MLIKGDRPGEERCPPVGGETAPRAVSGTLALGLQIFMDCLEIHLMMVDFLSLADVARLSGASSYWAIATSALRLARRQLVREAREAELLASQLGVDGREGFGRRGLSSGTLTVEGRAVLLENEMYDAEVDAGGSWDRYDSDGHYVYSPTSPFGGAHEE